MNLSENSLKNHMSYMIADEVAEICKPLFEHCNLNFFDYARIYPDKSSFVLISNKTWYYHYIKSNYPIGGTVAQSGVHLWENYLPEIMITDAAQYMDHCNGISIYHNTGDYIEQIDIAAPTNNKSVIDFYFNNLDILNQFLFYFKDKAADLIKKSDRNRFIIPKTPSAIIKNDSYNKFCDFIKTNRIRLNCNSKEIIINKREYEVLLQLAQGKTAKEAARALNLSPRTIEDYVATAKEKSNFAFKSQLIDTLRDNLISARIIKH